jgi:hypothetical protein
MPRRRRRSAFNHFFVILPNRLYPFSATIAGKRVRGRRAYEFKVAQFERRYGPGHWGFFINLYRSFFHVTGSILVFAAFMLVARNFFGNERALYLTLGAMTLLITYQEFYYHPRVYGQLWRKDVLDWLSWMVPVGLYFFFLR